MTLWLMDRSSGEILDQAMAAGWKPSASQEANIEARLTALSSGRAPSIYSAGNVAQVRIEGALTKKPDPMAWLFGSMGTSYDEIIAAFRAAENDSSVASIDVLMDSPGGQVAGLFETIAALQGFSKPRRVLASNANSAAYALASVMGPIEATSPASSFGSRGIFAQFRSSPGVITMRSTDAPKKNPDPASEDGQAEIQAYMDSLHGLFIEAIADGRGVPVATINQDFGRGASLLAAQAFEKGMIDSISKPVLKAVSKSPIHHSATHTAAKDESFMDLKTLKAQHPDLYEAVLQLGIDQEKERVTAHLDMAEQLDATSVALDAIKAGTRVDHQPTLAKYFAISRNRQDQTARADDDAVVVDATANAEAPVATADLGDALAALYTTEAN